MKSKVPISLDDILFESRNKDYGSYRLRKQYFFRLAISFIISLAAMAMLALSYSWYLNFAGDESVYFYSSSIPKLKNTQGSLLSPRELSALMNHTNTSAEHKVDQNTIQSTDVLHNFTIAENVTPDTLKLTAEIDLQPATGTVPVSSNDSTVFGGFLSGNGEGEGTGINLDRFPVFPGGAVHKYIESILYYPVLAAKKKIHGIVIVSFVVNKSGEVVNIKVERSAHPLLDAEAVKAVKSLPRWQPGLRHGRPISVQLVIPVNFIPLN
jgi:protein TonB